MINDPAGWLNVDKDTGLIKVRRFMDREAPFVTNSRYIANIGACDDGRWELRLLHIIIII